MNLDIYTNKSKEAIQSAQQLMSQNHNPQLEQIHLLVALLEQEDGLVPQLLKKMDVPWRASGRQPGQSFKSCPVSAAA